MSLWSLLKKDYQAVFRNDPAARSGIEVVLAYPGFHAIFLHRIIHPLWNMGIPVMPRLLSNISRFLTGIDIHPAAKIGAGFFIDHGMGVVIGETSEIGEDCLLYQGVTLGGTGKERGKRHPTLGSNVIVGAGAKILGAITIGSHSKIGANAVVLDNVPDYSIVVGVPGRVIKKKVLRMAEEGPIESLARVYMPDPIEEKFAEMERYISELEKKIEKPEGKKGIMRVYNTLTGRKEELIPLIPNKIGIYVCGVTVYDLCHIGHARSAIVFDVMRRYLKFKGLEVRYIRNFTDIDDKIINRAHQEGIKWDEVARKYTDEYYKDMDRLGVGRADVEPKATGHISEIVSIIKGLMEKGYAYAVDGDVYFEVSKFHEYGKLSKRDLEEMIAGARIEVDERKRNPMDFALWKSSKEGEPSWESPWGNGRPGWHIECTAMSMKHLSESFDIHGGGADLIFPHHENELSQSEAYSGKPFVRYWLHNGFITIDKEKMSKSLGNFFTVREILDKFDPEVVRLFLLSTHYRSPIEFSDAVLKEAEATLDRYYSTKERISDFLNAYAGQAKNPAEEKEMEEAVSHFMERFKDAMDDDFNTALSLGHMFELIREANRYLDARPSGQKSRDLASKAMDLLNQAGNVLNIFGKTPDEWQDSLMQSKKISLTRNDILDKINKRQESRDKKDWASADAIRRELEEMGIMLEDKKDGTMWKVSVNK